MDHVDIYCERTSPGLWAEPVNAVTNGTFLLAGAILCWLLLRDGRRAPVWVWLLPVTTMVVGLCSLAFHTAATRFTGLLDTVSIVAFILIALVVTVHQIWAVPWKWAWLAAPAFIAFAAGFNAVLALTGGERALLGGYLPALIALVGFGLAIRLGAPPELRPLSGLLFWAAALFAVSLTLRTLDTPWCAGWPLGTHFLWHCLNATVLYLVSYTVVRLWRSGARGFREIDEKQRFT